jgi:hypothetical protein
MNLIFGPGEQIILLKLLSYNLENSKKILFNKIKFIMDENQDEKNFEENFHKYDEIFIQILNLTSKKYSLDFEEIDILLSFENLIFEFVEYDMLDIEYYNKFILDLPDNFLLTYSNICRIYYHTLHELKEKYNNESKKLIEIIEKKTAKNKFITL